MKEIWKDIKGYEGKYQVSNFGQIKYLGLFDALHNPVTPEHLLKLDKKSDKYYVSLYAQGKDNIFSRRSVTQIVAEAFIPNPNKYTRIIYIDDNKGNNKVENLKWVDENEYKNFQNRSRKVKNKSGIPVRCVQTGKIYSSFVEASEDTGDSVGAIKNCAMGKTRHTKRYVWEFADEHKTSRVILHKKEIPNLVGEEWKLIEIEGFENLYSVSNLGRVKSHVLLTKEKLVEPIIWKKEKERNDTTYFAMVTLHNNKNVYTVAIKNLVAQAFVPHPKKLEGLRHKDGNQLNCKADNLEWYNPTDERSERSQENYYKYLDHQTQRKKPVRCIETGREFESLKEAERQTGINSSWLTQVCVGRAHTAGGYHWKFVNKEDNFLLNKKI